MAEKKNWAQRHPIITGALVGSVIPGVGTVIGAVGGLAYSITQEDNVPSKDEEEKK